MILIDASTPAIAVQATGTIATVVSGSFVPPGGSVIAVRYSANTIDPNDPGNPLITDSLGVHLNWISVDIGKRPDAPTADGQVATWVAVVPTGTPSMTITVTNGAASPNRHAALRPLVLTGVDVIALSGQHGKSSSTTNITSIAASYTASRDGSLGLLVVADWFDAGAESAGGTGNTLEGSADVASNYTYAFLRRTNPDGVAGATTTITATVPTSSNIRWAWLEMLPEVGGGGVQPIPPHLVRALAAWKLQQYGPSLQAAQQSVEAGAGMLTIVGTGVAVKKVAQTGACLVPVRASGVGVKKAPQVAAAAVALVGTGADVKKAPQVGTALLAVAATGQESTASARAQTGTAMLAVRATGVGVKRTPQAGAAELAIRATGAEIHQQAQTGATPIALRGTGTDVKVAKESGTALLAVAPGGTGAKKVAQAGTAEVAIVGTGVTGNARVQTGRCVVPIRASGIGVKRAVVTGTAMLATVGAATAGKRTPEAGAAAFAIRTTGLLTKKAAQVGKAALAIAPVGTGGKRTAATGRTVVPILGFGTATLELPPVRLGERLDDIFNALVTFTLRLGIFQRVQQHEPKSAPRNGLTAALWLQAMAPAIGQSSISSTSLRVSWFLRIYQNFLSEPQDLIDPSVMKACASVMEALTANFDLDLPQVRAIDLLGITGPPMAAEAGYIPMGSPTAPKLYRCMTLTIPIIVDDVFVQAA